MGQLLKNRSGFILIDTLFFIYIIFICIYVLSIMLQTMNIWIENNKQMDEKIYEAYK